MSYQVHITSTAEHDIMRAADYIEQLDFHSSTGIFPHLRNLFLCRFLLFMPYKPKGYMSYFSSFSLSKSFMLLTLIAKVDVLCKSADVAGCITPPIPHKINPVLKPTICR